MVCAYLIQVCRLSVLDALSCFGAARPPGVKHEKFVVELSRYALASTQCILFVASTILTREEFFSFQKPISCDVKNQASHLYHRLPAFVREAYRD